MALPGPEPDVVVFDLDGTLFDHPAAAREGLRAWVRSLGAECTAALEAAWFDAEDRHWRAWRDGRVTFTEQRRGRLREFLPLLGLPAGSDDELDERFTAGFLPAYRRSWRGYPDVAAALDAVRAAGLVPAVLTNGPRELQHAKIEAIGLTGRLGQVVTAEDLGVAKPDPAAFTRTCERLGVEPARALYVGDDHVVDVLAARAAGMRAVHLDRTGAGPVEEAERITTLHRLAEFLVPR